MAEAHTLSCTCGQVQLTARQSPIIVTECHCNSCRSAGAVLQTLPGATSVLDANGGTPFVLYRKDRIGFPKGSDLLAEYRLSPDAPTRRVVASCCNTALFLEFEHGHWLSIYGHLWPQGTMPGIEVRTMTGDRAGGPALGSEIPSGKLATAGFYARLLGAWIAMGFKQPKIRVGGTVTP